MWEASTARPIFGCWVGASSVAYHLDHSEGPSIPLYIPGSEPGIGMALTVLS